MLQTLQSNNHCGLEFDNFFLTYLSVLVHHNMLLRVITCFLGCRKEEEEGGNCFPITKMWNRVISCFIACRISETNNDGGGGGVE